MSDFSEQYESLTTGAGVFSLGLRTRIEIFGTDRQTLLHNLCTQDVCGLQPGRGCEAFLTNIQAKVLAHVNVLADSERLILDTVPGQANRIFAHLDRYIIREDARLEDRSADFSSLLLAGREADEVLGRLQLDSPASELLSCEWGSLLGNRVSIVRVDWTRPGGYLIQCLAEHADESLQGLVDHGARICEAEAFESARIEAASPWYGRDVTEENLAQEVGRDDSAIHFQKGCYLGQETIARIDALGHPNRLLRTVRFEGDSVPPDGTPLLKDEKPVGRVTSAAWSPLLASPLALAYVGRGQNDLGTKLSSGFGAAEIVRLPGETST